MQTLKMVDLHLLERCYLPMAVAVLPHITVVTAELEAEDVRGLQPVKVEMAAMAEVAAVAARKTWERHPIRHVVAMVEMAEHMEVAVVAAAQA